MAILILLQARAGFELGRGLEGMGGDEKQEEVGV